MYKEILNNEKGGAILPTDNMKFENGRLFMLGIEREDGDIVELGPISEIQNIESTDISVNDSPINRVMSNEPVEISVTLEFPNGLTKDDFILMMFYGIPANKLLCNNWRKMHKLPMKRRLELRRRNNLMKVNL